jgi:heme/copper-type cytochrome/quinol oxidase subunit 2
MDYNFDSLIIEEADLIIGSRRLLETSKTLVLPYQAVIRFLISSIDVLHA